MPKRQKSEASQKENLRRIPSVTKVLKYPAVKKLFSSHNRLFIVATVRNLLGLLRKKTLAGEKDKVSAKTLSSMVLEAVEWREKPTLRKVINATGVILHTGLGRALLSNAAAEAVKTAASNYCNLELDLHTGMRGSRQSHVEKLICDLTGGESALVVNNNAAAVLLSLNTMASGREVLVSRGELIEIGGSFRLPEIMKKSGCKLVEVGTTNRTTLEDYRHAVSENTGLLLKVHASNYEIVGFAEVVSLREMVQLGQELDIPVMYDLGSGALIPLDSEPVAERTLGEGVDVISFSADKLLGGPQAGIIVGKKELVDQMKRNPIARVTRVCKLTLAALQATLLEYLTTRDISGRNPTIEFISTPVSHLEKSASELARKLRKRCGDKLTIEVVDGNSMIGGGSFPTKELPTRLLAIQSTCDSVDELARRLRTGDPPIVARVANERLLLDVRTIKEDELKEIVSSISKIVQQ